MRVFICDDNRDYRTLIKLVLTDALIAATATPPPTN